MVKGVINFDDLAMDYSKGQILHYSNDFDGSKTQALLYLWLFNHFHTNSKEVTTDSGRPMYRNLAKVLNEIIEYGNHEDILRQCLKFVNMSNRWTREKILEERENLLPKLRDFGKVVRDWEIE